MPIGLILVGMMVLLAAVRGKHAEFGQLIASDFSGSKSFWQWIAALGITGSIGYYKPLEGYSRLFMILLLLALLLANKGFFKQFASAFGGIQRGAPNVTPKPFDPSAGRLYDAEGPNSSAGPVPQSDNGPTYSPGA